MNYKLSSLKKHKKRKQVENLSPCIHIQKVEKNSLGRTAGYSVLDHIKEFWHVSFYFWEILCNLFNSVNLKEERFVKNWKYSIWQVSFFSRKVRWLIENTFLLFRCFSIYSIDIEM